MRHIPQLKAELDKPRSCRSDRYSFSNLVSFFQGSGRRIVSKSAKIRVSDQLDCWSSEFKNNLEDLRKRGRSYSQSMLWKVCTPTTENGRIWKQFLKSSQGYWTLYCDQCGDWTMRSCDLHNLQFQSQYNEQIKEHVIKKGSCVLVCPKCGAQHTEDEKYFMNRQGKYIHKVPQRLELHPGFQFGVLCSLFPFMTWDRIAEKILQSGKRADIDAHMQLDNSWRGLCYKRRQVVKQDFDKIKQHCWKAKQAPTLQNVQIIFMTADTQQAKSVVGVFALDVNDNLHLIQTAEPEYITLSEEDRSVINSTKNTPIITVQDMLNKEYLKKDCVGIKPMFCVMDRQGHRSTEVQSFARKNNKVLMYQGTRLEACNYKPSNTNNRLMMVAARHYQAVLIYYLYSQKKRGQNYLYFMPDISDDVLKQILAIKPDNSKKHGDAPENWQAENGAVHDFFDVIKMAYFAQQFILEYLSRNKYRFGQSPAIKRRWEGNIPVHVKVETPQPKKNNWFSK